MTQAACSCPDVLVIGLGAMGSAAAYQLAKRGANVVGVDQFIPPHVFGSTHGETRITRQAICEGQQFVPLALRSHQLWRDIERETGRALLTQCGGVIVVSTSRGSYTPGTTIVSAGAWLPALLPQVAQRIVVRRQVVYWFAVEADAGYGIKECPIFIWHWGAGPDDVFYGFPQIGDVGGLPAIKIATEQNDTATTPESVERTVTPDEMATMFAQHIRGRLRGVTSRCVKASTCLYTNAPGANFLIDRMPDALAVIVVSACSGHGFKHSAAIGEAVAAMVASGVTPDVLRPFSFAEFAALAAH